MDRIDLASLNLALLVFSYQVRGLKREIRNPPSAIRNFKSAIANTFIPSAKPRLDPGGRLSRPARAQRRFPLLPICQPLHQWPRVEQRPAMANTCSSKHWQALRLRVLPARQWL